MPNLAHGHSAGSPQQQSANADMSDAAVLLDAIPHNVFNALDELPSYLTGHLTTTTTHIEWRHHTRMTHDAPAGRSLQSECRDTFCGVA